MPKPSRFWFYKAKDTCPPWWNRFGLPWFGSDEWGRLTIVIGTGLTGYLVYAYWTCKCAFCMDSRLYQVMREQHGEDVADAVLEYRLRVRGMPEDGSPRV